MYLLRNAALAAFWAFPATAPAAQTVPMAVPLLERGLFEAMDVGPELSPSSTAKEAQLISESCQKTLTDAQFAQNSRQTHYSSKF